MRFELECGDYHDRAPQHGPRTRGKTLESSTSRGIAKEQVREILEILPESASFEEIQYHIDIRQKVQQGWLAGRMISLEEIEGRLTNWLARWSSRAWSSVR